MLPVNLDQLHTILCLGAHADDIEIGCGGTLLELLRRRPGLAVHWVVFSASGQRAVEARRSAELFLRDAGQRQIMLAEFRDTYFPFQGAEIKDYFEQIKQAVRPELVFTHRREDLHQDHRLLAELTWCGFRNHVILEYEIPKYEGDLGAPNCFVPLPEEACQQKIAHLLTAFPSQQSKPWFTDDTFQALLRLRGLECNSPTRFAEAFTARKLCLALDGRQ